MVAVHCHHTPLSPKRGVVAVDGCGDGGLPYFREEGVREKGAHVCICDVFGVRMYDMYPVSLSVSSEYRDTVSFSYSGSAFKQTRKLRSNVVCLLCI